MASLLKKAKLLAGLRTGCQAKTGPFYVDIDVTNRCNLNCVGCPFHSPHLKHLKSSNNVIRDISHEMVKELCRDLKRMDTNLLIFQGAGEPLCHPNILEMISSAKEMGFRVFILTNGTLLKGEMIDTLIDLNVDTIKISLWANNEEQAEKNYPDSPMQYKKILNNIAEFCDKKSKRKSMLPLLIIYNIINRYNYHGLDSTVEFAIQTKCDGFYVSPMYFPAESLKDYMPSPEEEDHIRKYFRQLKKRLRSSSMDENIDWALLRYRFAAPLWQYMPCYAAWFHARVRADGLIQPCGRCSDHVQFGNLNNESFQDIWNNTAIQAFRYQTLHNKESAINTTLCNCQMCCFLGDNLKIHQVMRWINIFKH